ncbi:hypothetical protein FHS01_005715 [Longimicrobium terrae]|uniref:Uncharacterized protein n=1 Tax=Longimicrobium terrae TaxID=1639882 RepID=A0A841H7X7_9BACT|nr:hypothetical protein [Longimicrobium terrae]MBB6074033.1 hypothetical protein [Longimicrobium terrae]
MSRGFPLFERRIHSLNGARARGPSPIRTGPSAPTTLPQSFLGEGGPVVPARVGAALNSATRTESPPRCYRSDDTPTDCAHGGDACNTRA